MMLSIIRKVWIALLVINPFLSAEVLPWQTYKIVDLAGVYDFNGNGQAEFFTVFENGSKSGSPVIVRHNEIDGEGYQLLLWELILPEDLSGQFVDLEIADLAGDGSQQLIVLVNISEVDENSLRRPVLYVYDLEEDGFSEEPSDILDLSDAWGYVKSNNLQKFDIDGDDASELVVSLGSPRRSLALIDLTDDGSIEVSAELVPESLKSGSGMIYSAVLDYDGNGYDDLIALSPEGGTLKLQPYYNEGGSLVGGTPEQQVFQGISRLLPRALTAVDWDSDGFLDILLPFRSGHLIALTMNHAGTPIEEVPVDAGPLSDLKVADLNQDNFPDLILAAGEMNMLTVAYGNQSGSLENVEYFSLEGEAGAQVFQILPIVSQGLYSGTILAGSWSGLLSDIFTSDLGYVSGEAEVTASEIFEEQIDLIEAFPEILEEKAEKIIDHPQAPVPFGRDLPEGILPRFILSANQVFAYTIPEDDMRQFYSFRWLKAPPKGMFFHYESRSIRWIPGPDQLGAYQLSYRIEMKTGEEIDLGSREPDSLITYQMVPELEGYDERLWIYINDPPQFISEPESTVFVSNAYFSYQPQVVDQNSDADIKFSLEVSPPGMVLGNGGWIEWQTDSSHVTSYPVRLVASDGFERTVQDFTLNPRAGVVIQSASDTLAHVNKEFRYQIESWQPDIDVPLKYSLVKAPDGMAVNETGLVTWTPTPAQIDYQEFRIVLSHGIARDTQDVRLYVNHPPVIERAPGKLVMVRLGETYDFQISAHDPNQADLLQYSPLLLPEGMRMDPFNGRLFWEPTTENIDFSHLLVAISDGFETRMIESEFYVNAPISIISEPPARAEVGQPYLYDVKTSDPNRGNLLQFDKIIAIENLENIRIYGVRLSDKTYIANINRYIADWEMAENVYNSSETEEDDWSASRIDLKKYVSALFYEDDRLVVIIETIDRRTVPIKDVLWEFFQGNKGKPPRVVVERIPVTRYSLLEFPDGMEVDELSGNITWTPDKDQVDIHTVRLMASDGYLRDEQTFKIYVNHPPVIVSKPAEDALVGEIFRYQIIAEDKNADANLKYSLLKAPTGMQMNKGGRVAWKPKPSQIKGHVFKVKVSDGYSEDVQTGRIYVNISPSIISTPKPVALTGYEYRYKLVVEDLNKDRISFRPLRIPKYARFNPRSGILSWKPRSNQKGPNDILIMAVDERGAATAHEFQVHVFEDPSSRQLVRTGWPLLLTFVGVMFAWGVAQI